MIIACATDRRYVEMTGVLIRSICAQSHTETVEIVVFCASLRQKDKDRLMVCAFGTASLTLIDIPLDVHAAIRNLPVKRHLSVTAYVSIYIPNLLRHRTGRLLYLDSDIVVNAPLDVLFRSDLRGLSVGAVPDTTSTSRVGAFNAAIGHPPDAPYFNSGVFLVDIGHWNERQVTQRGADYALHRTGPVLQHDQAVLNHVLKDDWAPLDPVWNDKPTRLPACEVAAMPILHYRGRLKPFHSDFPKEYRAIYDAHRAHTPWAKAWRSPPIRRSLEKRLRMLMDILRRLGGKGEVGDTSS